MKQLLKTIVSAVLIACISSVALAAEDIRISLLRDGDDLTPYAESIYFTRYTPWFKSLHITSAAEKAKNIVGGEACQQIRCLDISPVDENHVVFGSDTSGVWITKNGGEHWYNTMRNLPKGDIADVMFHPNDKNIIFAYTLGTDESLKPGIYRSTDMGKIWSLVHADYIESSRIDKLFAYDNSGNIYAVTAKGIIKSENDGEDWTYLKKADEEANPGTINSNANTTRATSISVSGDGQMIYACYAKSGFSLNGINVSTDGGISWTKLPVNGQSDANVYSFAVAPENNKLLIAALSTEMYVSTDGGENWNKFTDVSSASHISKIRMNNKYIYTAYDSKSSSFRRLDYTAANFHSKTFEIINLASASADRFLLGKNMNTAQGFDISGDIIFAAASGINKSEDNGKSWTRKSSGYSGLSVNHFYMDDEGNMILSMIDGNLVKSDSAYTSTNTPTFTGISCATGSKTVSTMLAVDPSDDKHYIVWNGQANSYKAEVGIIVTKDGGKTYVDEKGTTLTPTETNTNGVPNYYYKNRISDPKGYNTRVLEYDTENPRKIYASCATSIDNGENWTPNPYLILDICDEDPDKMIAWDVYGTSPTMKIMYSTDRGVSWEKLCDKPNRLASSAEGFFDKADSNKFWLTSELVLGYIDIAEKKFITVSKNVPTSAQNDCLVQNPRYPNHMLLGLKNTKDTYSPGLLESLDGGKTWHVVPGLFGMRNIRTIAFSTTTNEAFLGSHNGTIVYEYDNFWHYTTAKLTDGTNTINTCLDVYKDSNGKKFILSPTRKFDTGEKIFTGWKYKNELYKTGAKIYID